MSINMFTFRLVLAHGRSRCMSCHPLLILYFILYPLMWIHYTSFVKTYHCDLDRSIFTSHISYQMMNSKHGTVYFESMVFSKLAISITRPSDNATQMIIIHEITIYCF
eukprot:174078_1